MTKPVTPATTYRVRMDDRRRPTLPPALLAAAGIDGGAHDLIARVDGPGRIVLEDPLALLAALQDSVAQGKAARGVEVSLVDDLLEHRSGDRSLR